MKSMIAVLAGTQSLAHKDEREMPVDRLGAIAFARVDSAAGGSLLASLGVDLIAFKFAHRVDSNVPAMEKLADIMAWRSNRLDDQTPFYLVAQWAIHEWVNEACEQCRGADEIPAYENVEGRQPMQVCPKCSGTKLRVWTDIERRHSMGQTYPKAMDVAHKFIGAAVVEARRTYARMLEKLPTGETQCR